MAFENNFNTEQHLESVVIDVSLSGDVDIILPDGSIMAALFFRFGGEHFSSRSTRVTVCFEFDAVF